MSFIAGVHRLLTSRGQLREIEDVWSAGGQGLVSLKVGGAGVWVFMPEDLDGPAQPFLPGKLHLSSHAAHRPPLPLCVSDGGGPHGWWVGRRACSFLALSRGSSGLFHDPQPTKIGIVEQT